MSRSLSSQLRQASRIMSTVEAVASGDPKRVARRGKNIAVGRALGRAGVQDESDVIATADQIEAEMLETFREAGVPVDRAV